MRSGDGLAGGRVWRRVGCVRARALVDAETTDEANDEPGADVSSSKMPLVQSETHVPNDAGGFCCGFLARPRRSLWGLYATGARANREDREQPTSMWMV